MTPETRDRWLSFIRLFEESHLTLKQFSQAQGLNDSTFKNYYYKLRQLIPQPPQASPELFLPVLVNDATPNQRDPDAVKLTLSCDLVLELNQLPAPQYLAQLVDCLRRI